MAVWGNFVQTATYADIGLADTSILVESSATWDPPPNPGGTDVAYLTIADSATSPTVREIISYTSRLGFGPWTLTGVTRGLEGTTPKNWPTGSFVMQYITAAQIIDPDVLAASTLDGGTF